MSLTDAAPTGGDEVPSETHEAAHHEPHETPQERHKKEHMAVWLFIGGDAVFFVLEIFFWFYLRTLNTNGMWTGALCSKANQCTDGLGNPITAPIAKANGAYTLGVVALMIVSAAFVWFGEVQARQGGNRKVTTPILGVGVLFCLAAIGLQFYQFQVLPFQTIDGTYASLFEFFMGSNIAHFLIALVISIGVFNRSRLGKYENHNWYQIHLTRLFVVWVAFSATILALIATFFV